MNTDYAFTKVKVITSRDPDIHAGMIGVIEPEPMPGGHAVTFEKVKRYGSTVAGPITIFLLSSEVQLIAGLADELSYDI